MKYKCISCNLMQVTRKTEFLCNSCKLEEQQQEQLDEELQVELMLLTNPTGKTRAFIEEQHNYDLEDHGFGL